ncbi:uncharacterized protein VTP21DRAFT_7877 [Calcarisporiella thermophila]|uniref:uncharacterized protein n=1 Tax=Calcarisporiella thermophila TaxID=911321 RepID=UPI0037442A15
MTSEKRSNESIKAIDAWANPVIPFLEGIPEVRPLFEKSHVDFKFFEKRCTPAELVALMDAANIHKICLNAWYRPGRILFSNDEVAEYTRAYPDRFIGIAGVDLADPVAACRELDRAVNELGCRGLRVVPWLWNLPPNDKLYYPLFVKCVELDIPFFTQVGHTGPHCPSEPGRPIPYIDDIALRFPALKIVGGHIGHPWTEEMIAVAWKHPNVYIDTSAHLPRYYPKSLIHFLSTTGKRQVLFGTNFPQLSWKKCMQQVEELGLKEDVKERFLWKNMEDLLSRNHDKDSRRNYESKL